jgi:hypothetical protein
MGYYSDVMLCLRKSAVEEFQNRLVEISNEADDAERLDIADTLRRAIIYENDGDIALIWYDIKWYHSFFGVTAILQAVENLEQEDYWYGEIGEAYDDASQHGWLVSKLCPGISRKFDLTSNGLELLAGEIFQLDKIGVHDE